MKKIAVVISMFNFYMTIKILSYIVFIIGATIWFFITNESIFENPLKGSLDEIVFLSIWLMIFYFMLNIPYIHKIFIREDFNDFKYLTEFNLFFYLKYKILISNIKIKSSDNNFELDIDFFYKRKKYNKTMILDKNIPFNIIAINKIYQNLLLKIIETNSAKVIVDYMK